MARANSGKLVRCDDPHRYSGLTRIQVLALPRWPKDLRRLPLDADFPDALLLDYRQRRPAVHDTFLQINVRDELEQDLADFAAAVKSP